MLFSHQGSVYKNHFTKTWFRPGSNRGPFACKANVITTTLRNLIQQGEFTELVCAFLSYQGRNYLRQKMIQVVHQKPV